MGISKRFVYKTLVLSHFFQDIHAGQEEIVKFVVERNEFEIRIGYWFIHSSFLLFF